MIAVTGGTGYLGNVLVRLGFEPRPLLQTLDDTLRWFRQHDRL